MPRDRSLTAIPLRRRRFGEADAVVIFLTREAGKIAAVARGVSKEKSRLSGHLREFSKIALELHDRPERGAESLPLVRGARTARARFADPPTEVAAAFFWAADLILRETGDENPDPALFDFFDRAMEYLAGHPADFSGEKFRAQFLARFEEIEGRKIEVFDQNF